MKILQNNEYVLELVKFAVMLLVVALLTESPRLSFAITSDNTALAESPLIDESARVAYTNGSIKRATAITRINSHLYDLEHGECIQDWEEKDGTYLITMNNGARFSYQLN